MRAVIQIARFSNPALSSAEMDATIDTVLNKIIDLHFVGVRIDHVHLVVEAIAGVFEYPIEFDANEFHRRGNPSVLQGSSKNLALSIDARDVVGSSVITLHMMEALAEDYQQAFAKGSSKKLAEKPEVVKVVMKEAVRRSWQHLAEERIEDIQPTIPLGKRFWPLWKVGLAEIRGVFEKASVSQLVTNLRGLPDDGDAAVLDAAYWVEGCSLLGRMRYAMRYSWM